jgi:hypothetical protein
MSVHDAMQFIARVRTDEQIREEVRALGIDPDLSEVVAIGGRLGLRFSVEELRSAYGYEWTMRSLYYGFQKKEGA